MNDVPLHMRKCLDCAYFLKRDDQPTKGNCLFNPPVVQFVPMIARQEAPKMALPSRAQVEQSSDVPQFFPSSALPLVRTTDFCHNWTAKTDGKTTH